MADFDPIDFQPNSVGTLVVRVIRLKDIMRTLDCTEARALAVVKEIRGETSADGETAVVLPSQLARWLYRRAGEPVPPPPSRAVLIPSRAALSQMAESASLDEVQADLKRIAAGAVQPGAMALTVEQAAARLGCSRRRIFDLLKAGVLKRSRKFGRRVMIALESIDRALSPRSARRRARAASPAGFELEDVPI